MSARYYDKAQPQWITVDDEGDIAVQIEDQSRNWISLTDDDKRNLAIDLLASISDKKVSES